MAPDDFKRIEDHIVKKGLSKKSARFAFSIFIDYVSAGMKNFTDRNNRGPNQDEVRSICEHYLSEPLLDNYFSQAQTNESTTKIELAQSYSKEVF